MLTPERTLTLQIISLHVLVGASWLRQHNLFVGKEAGLFQLFLLPKLA